MTTDDWLEWASYHSEWLPVVRAAVGIVERQRAEIERLRVALRPFVSGGEWEADIRRLLEGVPADKASRLTKQFARLQAAVDAALHPAHPGSCETTRGTAA